MLTGIADPGVAQTLAFRRASCAGGWALAVGSGSGYSGPVLGLFNEQDRHWKLITLDDGSGLGLDPGMYDLPLPTLYRLAAGLGPSVQPAVASAALSNGLNQNLDSVSGVMTINATDWVIKAQQSANRATVDVAVYEWTGSSWAIRAQLDNIPDRGSLTELNGWYSDATPFGSQTVALVVRGILPSWSVLITDAGGYWRVAP